MYRVHTCFVLGMYRAIVWYQHTPTCRSLYPVSTFSLKYVPGHKLLKQYQHVLVCTEYIQHFSPFSTVLLYWLRMSIYLEFLILLRASRAKQVCLQVIHTLAHAFNQITPKQVYSLLLVDGSTLACQCTPRQWCGLARGFSCCWSASPD
jgi:hypothetical protein